jgi:hypothetical protein
LQASLFFSSSVFTTPKVVDTVKHNRASGKTHRLTMIVGAAKCKCKLIHNRKLQIKSKELKFNKRTIKMLKRFEYHEVLRSHND